MIELRKGKIYSIDNMSGHYKPNDKSLEKIIKSLKINYPNLVHKNMKVRGNDE